MGDGILEDLEQHLRAITDPLERAKRAQYLYEQMPDIASKIRFEAITELGSKMSHAEIAEALGLTRARVSQLVKAGPPQERALIAPDTGPVHVAVVLKKDVETGQRTIALSTQKAVAKLQGVASDMGLKIEPDPEAYPQPGHIDLNRTNLVVLIGPRISSLIAQVIASDPVIKWRQDKRGRWFITDTKTGVEYHSDFDEGWETSREGERTCIAHIGRIRRPDGLGSFLYLGGAHAPGTAGATDVFIREINTIWAQAKRSLWSAVVLTRVSEDGEIVSADLATPIYVHGKR